MVAIAASFLLSIATNDNMRWDVVLAYLFDRQVLLGLLNTIILTVLCMALGIGLGIVVAVMAMSSNPVISVSAKIYVWLFRGIPLLVQLIFWFNLSLLWPRLGLIITPLGIDISLSTNAVISSFIAAALGLALHEAAYMSEIVRAGILGVDPGQVEAARSLGISEGKVISRIILPQAMRIIVPPTGNQFISLLKATSLVAFIGGGELMTEVQSIYALNFLVIPLLIVASLWYMAVTTLASIFQKYLENHFGQGFGRRSRPEMGNTST